MDLTESLFPFSARRGFLILDVEEGLEYLLMRFNDTKSPGICSNK